MRHYQNRLWKNGRRLMPESTRKLAAIVFTDIVGFTKFTAKNEPAALKLLETQRSLLKPIVQSHGGEWLKELGDGLLLSFENIRNAVDAAIEIQNAVSDIDYLDLRIGIHQGEVIFSNNDVIGDDVNIAARIEPFAATGGIAVSGRVNASLERDPVFTTKHIGRPALKGVSQKIEVYCITSHGLPETDLSSVSAKLEQEGFQWNVKNSLGIAASMIGLFMLINFMFLRIGFADEEKIPSIAVLLMQNNGTKEDGFWVKGITEDVIIELGSAGLIKVAPMAMIKKLDQGEMTFIQMADKLDVRHLLTSSLKKDVNEFILRCQLLDMETDETVFAKKWVSPLDSISMVTRLLSDLIRDELDIKDIIVLSNPVLFETDAYEMYLRGKVTYETRKSEADVLVAKALLEDAISMEPEFLLAKIILAKIYSREMQEPQKSIDILKTILAQAKTNNDQIILGMALRVLGGEYYELNDYDKGDQYTDEAIGISKRTNDYKTLTGALNNKSTFLEAKGQIEKPLKIMLETIDLAVKTENWSSASILSYNAGIIYIQRFNLVERGLEYIGNAYEYSDRARENFWKAIISQEYAYYLGVTDQLKHAKEILNETDQLIKELNHPLLNFQFHLFRGHNLMNDKDYSAAAREFEQSYNFAKKAGIRQFFWEPLGYASRCYAETEDKVNAALLFDEGVKINEEKEANNRAILFYNNMTITANILNRDKDEILFLEKAMDKINKISKSFENPELKSLFRNNVPINRGLIEKWAKVNKGDNA